MVVLDFGVHNGSTFPSSYSQDSSIAVYIIEPNPQVAEILRSQHSQFHVFCMAFGETEGVEKFYLDSCNRILPAHSHHSQANLETIDVSVQRLDSFINAQRIPQIDLLNIDAPGFCLKVLRSAGNFLQCIHKIRVNLPFESQDDGNNSKQEIVEYLSDRGFRLFDAFLPNGLTNTLEFIRVNRYPLTKPEAEYFEVYVPYLGVLKTPKQDHVGQLLEQGSFEGLEQAFLWLYLRPGDAFFDCGTHAGLFSCIAAKRLGNQGKIFGFDPNPICLNLYEQNLKALGDCPFTALNVGLSDQDGRDRLLLGKPGLSAFSTFASKAIDHAEISTETIEVTQRSLDSILSEFQIPQVTLAKLDVEGWENFVLMGAQQSIATGKFPLWMIEFTEANARAAGSSTQKLRSLIEQLGYTLCRFDGTTFRLVPEPHRPTYPYVNLFAVMDIEAANQRLQTADPEIVAIAQDLILRYDTAAQRDSTTRHLLNLQAVHSNASQALEQLKQELEATQALNQKMAQTQQHLESELAYLSTGRAAIRGVIKSSLRKLGLYDFVYQHHRLFVPIYNQLFGDRWQPATLKKGVTR